MLGLRLDTLLSNFLKVNRKRMLVKQDINPCEMCRLMKKPHSLRRYETQTYDEEDAIERWRCFSCLFTSLWRVLLQNHHRDI